MHLLNLGLYSLAIGVVFSLFMREGTRERARFAAWLSGIMVLSAVAAGWLMLLIG